MPMMWDKQTGGWHADNSLDERPSSWPIAPLSSSAERDAVPQATDVELTTLQRAAVELITQIMGPRCRDTARDSVAVALDNLKACVRNQLPAEFGLPSAPRLVACSASRALAIQPTALAVSPAFAIADQTMLSQLRDDVLFEMLKQLQLTGNQIGDTQIRERALLDYSSGAYLVRLSMGQDSQVDAEHGRSYAAYDVIRVTKSDCPPYRCDEVHFGLSKPNWRVGYECVANTSFTDEEVRVAMQQLRAGKLTDNKVALVRALLDVKEMVLQNPRVQFAASRLQLA